MGALVSNVYYRDNLPPETPKFNSEPTFDPHFGFESPRKERVMKMTEEEMRAMHIPPKARDYCAHLLRDVKICHRRTAPFHILCTKERHAYIHCLEEDYILRMKEFERERRLRIRQAKLDGKTI